MNAIVQRTLAEAPPDTIEFAAPEELLPSVESFMAQLVSGSASGLTRDMAHRQLSSRGKLVRARLALHSSAAFSVEPEKAVAWAAAVELLHNATLVHDDIQDGDTVRRGRPTIWTQFGTAQAINAGDFLLMTPFLALRATASEERGLLSGVLADYATRIVCGQAEELNLMKSGSLDRRSYMRACEGKTGALMALPVVGSALLGGYSLSEAEQFGRPFHKLGLLFQLQDDIVDLFGDKGREKPGCDIYEGKVSALLVQHLELAPETSAEVLSIVVKKRSETTRQDVEAVKALYVQSGALSQVLAQIVTLRDEALREAWAPGDARLSFIAHHLAQLALSPISHLFS